MSAVNQAAAEGSAIGDMKMARLKVELLSEGLRITRQAEELRVIHGKPPLRVRSGSCGGLDVVLPDGTYVNCPVFEHFVATSSFELAAIDDSLEIRHSPTGVCVPIELVPAPAYYDSLASDGTALSQIGQLCSDRLGIGITNRCVFWDSRKERCRFCSIGLNTKSGHETRDKTLEEILEVVDAAYTDTISPARHILLGGGTPEGPDAGTVSIARIAERIKERWPDRSIYAMVVPPTDHRYIDLLHQSGVDELGMNVEIFDEKTAATYIPGKHRQISLKGYLQALEHAVNLFGPINTRSITVVGLDPPEATIQGVELLASLGIMPILSPFRPLVGTEMELHPRMGAEQLWQIAVDASDAAGQHGMPLGPTCIPCQSNTLNVPGHPSYRYY